MALAFFLPRRTAALLLASCAVVGQLAASSPCADDPTDDQLRRAWKKVPREERGELMEWFAAEVSSSDSLQATLVRHVLGSTDRDPYDWPEASDKPPLFDPKVHCPADPIRRRWTSERSRKVKDWLARVFRSRPERALQSAWRYDWASGEVRRIAKADDPERVFENALLGYAPDLDLAEALVERRLDNGALRSSHAAFAHAYSDREGKAYPSVTLYDAWASGFEIEMPDVECLGIYHTVFDDWDRFVAPIPEAQHDVLYAQLKELFVRIEAQRSYGISLARAYLAAEPDLPPVFLPHADRMQALWERFRSDPAALAEDLPDEATDLDIWMEDRGKQVDSDRRAWQAGQVRKKALEDGAARVRKTLVRVFREAGHL